MILVLNKIALHNGHCLYYCLLIQTNLRFKEKPHRRSVLAGKPIATGQMRSPPSPKRRKAPSIDLFQLKAKAMIDTCIE